MVVGIFQFELLIKGAESLKDKRRVVNSVKDRLHREHLVAIAEVDRLEAHHVAVMALALVGNDGRRIGEVLDSISAKLRTLPDADLGDVQREIVQGRPGDFSPESSAEPDESLESELTLRAMDALNTEQDGKA
jgi:hypothetical protein